jgi:capsular exopolysaccharide synthesis family protein
MTEKTIILPPAHPGNGSDSHYRVTMMVPKRRYLSYLRERWWVLLVCVVALVSLALFLETTRPDRYNSYAQIYMSGNVQLNVGSVFSEESMTYFGTQIELLKSAPIQSAAFERAGITFAPGQKNPYKLEVTQPSKTSILQCQATGPDPISTQRFLAAVVAEYLDYKKKTRMLSSQDVLSSLQDELARKASDLQTNQDIWAQFQRSNNVAVLVEEGRTAGLYLSDLNMQIAKAQLDLKLLDPAQTNANAVPQTFALDSTNPIPSFALDSTTNSLTSSDDEALNEARLNLAQLLRSGDDPKKLAALGGPPGIQREVNRLTQLIALMIADKRNRLQQRVSVIQASLPTLESNVMDINERLAQGQRIKENVDLQQSYYDRLLALLENVDLGKNVQQEQLSVLQDATAGQPEARSLVSRLLLAAAGGIFIGLGLVFVWYLLDDRFVSFHDIRDQFGETFLGLVPQIKVPRAKPQAALLENSDSRPGYVESYRHLRSALLLSSFGEHRPQVILFTSSSPAEGKTTIAVNLARLLARSGLRVVLVDADGRGGGMRRLLGDNDKLGVLDYLRGEASAQAVVHPTEVDNLLQVPGGTHKEHAEGLFLSPKLAALIQELRQNADFVILDGAPVLASDAAALLVPHADLVVLVTRPFYTRSRLVRQSLDMLYQRQAKHVSIILNRARADDLAGHYAANGMSMPVAGNGKT